MLEYIKLAMSKYAQFEGRSRRSEFWFLYLGFVLAVFALGFMGSMLVSVAEEVGGYIFAIMFAGLFLGFIVPFLACAVRRLHDTGKSGWFLLLYFVPFGGLILLIFYCIDSDHGANQYGPNPKTGDAMDITSHLVD